MNTNFDVMTEKPIRNEADAWRYLELTERVNDTHTLVDGFEVRPGDKPVVVRPNPCWRCGGSGWGPWYVDGGRCFECHGHSTKNRVIHESVKHYAQRMKRNDRAAVKAEIDRKKRVEERIEFQRNWCEEHGHGRITFDELNERRRIEREEAKKHHVHVGTVKQREVFENLKVTFSKSFFSQFGEMYIIGFRDKDENALVWKTSNPPAEIDKGAVVTVKATVKEHTWYNEEAQTVLTRVVLEELIQEATV